MGVVGPMIGRQTRQPTAGRPTETRSAGRRTGAGHLPELFGHLGRPHPLIRLTHGLVRSPHARGRA
ncbi:hypothetical protein EV562_101687 [Streptomyces sp. BK208]|nr:hypothetical protein EV562_101687 [Streptomyces sp. BK208]